MGGEIIGQKGLGKLSLLRFGERVNFRTNNGEIGMDIIMTPKDFQYDIKSANKFLDHEGTRIIIPKPKGIPPTDELSTYLKKVFGLRIAKGAEIIFNGVKLGASSKINPSEKFLFRLPKKIEVTGNLKEDKKGHGTVEVYIRHVFVTSLIVDPERKFSGWINCNELIPTTSRNDIIRDNDNYVFSDMLEHLKQHVRKFPKTEEEITKQEELLGKELDKLLQKYLNEIKILPQGLMLTGKGDGDTSESATDNFLKKNKSTDKKEDKKDEKTTDEQEKKLAKYMQKADGFTNKLPTAKSKLEAVSGVYGKYGIVLGRKLFIPTDASPRETFEKARPEIKDHPVIVKELDKLDIISNKNVKRQNTLENKKIEKRNKQDEADKIKKQKSDEADRKWQKGWQKRTDEKIKKKAMDEQDKKERRKTN